MSRKDFISDHLVDMRAQLRDSYENYHQNKTAKSEPDNLISESLESTSASPEKESVAEQSPATRYLPVLKNNAADPDVRDKRDLEGRVLHDLAAIDGERELLTARLAELEKFAAVLENTRSVIYSEPLDINKLRLDYFSAKGRWSSLSGNIQYGSSIDGNNSRNDEKGAFFVAGAILAGSLIVGLILIGIFA